MNIIQSSKSWNVQISVDIKALLRNGAIVSSIVFGLGAAYYLGRTHAQQSVTPPRQVSQNEEIEELLGRFRVDEESLRAIMDLLEQEMDKGLDPQRSADSDLKMLPTYVRHLPDGTERGKIFALDLGGTNFRVLEVELMEDNQVEIISKIFLIPERLLSGKGEDLFDYLATSLASFMKARNIARHSKVHPCGFTFSFPCRQFALDSAVLIEWTKGFHCSDVVGNDVVKLMQDSIGKRTNMNVKVMALVNDTVGTLMTCAHKYKDCFIGVIFGTGTNACYVEDLERVKTWTGPIDEPKQVVINTEWGAFGDNGCLEFLRTNYDKEVDNMSVNPGKQTFEKMISGMYMGEIARLAILDLIEKQLIFPGLLNKGQNSLGYIRPIVTPGSFYSRFVSDIETDEGVAFKKTKSVLEEMGFKDPSYDDCAIIKYVCERISGRAAALSAAAIAVLVNRIGKPHVTIGVDGSLYRHHPKFKRNAEIALSRLVDRKITYRLVLSEDGSGKGAALVAAVADRVEKTATNLSLSDM